MRFYAGLRYHGIERDDLPWKAPFQPYLAYFAIGFCGVVAFFNGYDCFFPGNFSAKSFVPPYIDIPIVSISGLLLAMLALLTASLTQFLGLYIGYKTIKHTEIVKLRDMDLWLGKDLIDREEALWPVREPRNWLERIWFWIA